MSQLTLYAPVAEMRGELEKKSGIIMRRKKYRAPNGAVLKVGVQESYKIANPRDFDKTPPQGNEKANMQAFGEFSLKASEIIRAGKYTQDELDAMTPEQLAHVRELQTQLEDFSKRFYAQFKRPDPEAPFEKKPQPGSSKLLRKQYAKLDTFIQGILRSRATNQIS